MPDTIIWQMGDGSRAILTFGCDDIKCPRCNKQRHVGGLWNKKPGANGCWQIACTGCRLAIGVTFDMRGDAVCWDHKEAVAEKKRLDALPQPTAEETAAFLAALPPCDPEAEGRALLAEMEAKYAARTAYANAASL